MSLLRHAPRCLSPLGTTVRRSPRKPASPCTRPRRTVKPGMTACRKSAPGSGVPSPNSANASPPGQARAREPGARLLRFLDPAAADGTGRLDRTSHFIYLTPESVRGLANSSPELASANQRRAPARRSSIYTAHPYAALDLRCDLFGSYALIIKIK